MNKEIAIIGAGFTGLTAAYRLSKDGYKITIYERSSFLGGLASGLEMQGNNIEKTYHHLFRSDVDIINLVKELEIEDKLLWLKSSMSVYYDGKFYAYGTPKSLLLFKPLPFLDRIRQGFALLYLAKVNNWRKFLHISAYDWLSRWAGKNNMNVIFGPLLKGKFSNFYKDVSMAWMWARIHVRGNSQEKGGEKLGYFDGGFNVLVDALAKRLIAQGVDIVTNANVESIGSKEGKATIKIDSNEKQFDKVIATVPAHIFAKLIESSKVESDYLEKLSSINYLGAVIIVFSSEQKLGEYYWNNINDNTFPFLAFINHTNLVDKSKYNNKYVYYLGAYVPHDHKYFSDSEEDTENQWFEALQKLFPNFDRSKIIDKHIFKFKYAQHIVDLDYESKIPKYKTPVPNVYLANFSQIFPEDRGTNYAIHEGNKIAKLIEESA